MIRKQFQADLPVLAEGENGFAQDTKQWFVGTGTGNLPIDAGGALLAVNNFKDIDDPEAAVVALGLNPLDGGSL